MTTQVILTLRDEMYQRAKILARITGRTVQEILTSRFDQVIPAFDPNNLEETMRVLSDDEVLQLADGMMSSEEDAGMRVLMAENSKGRIDAAGREELEALLKVYEQGTLIKVHAIGEAVRRDLRTIP